MRFVLDLSELEPSTLATVFILKNSTKKLLKKMESAILWGVPDGIAYTQVKFKIPLAKIPLIQLQGLIDNYKKQFKRGEVFLNTNLEQLGVKL